MLLGIDQLEHQRFKPLRSMDIGLLTNFSCCDNKLKPTIMIFRKQKSIRLKAVFGPEHGIFSAVQDQKQVHDIYHKKRGLRVYSLYSKRRVADLKVLKAVDAVVIDLIDIGTRYYTFLWSAIMLIKQVARLKKRVFILDRPNPLNGLCTQGPVLEPEFSSFVGMYPIPVRHGMTIAELCALINCEYEIGAELEIIKMSGWHRPYYYIDTGLPWCMPSPNMPSFETACLYPGMCLLEGTNVSEGRGTTRPFEIFGAPWIDPFDLVEKLKKEHILGIDFRPIYFIPTFHKYRGELCGGIQIYITNLQKFDPVVTGLTIIKTVRSFYPDKFRWRKPPYEFERINLPFDILIGNSWIREAIEKNETITSIQRRWRDKLNRFKKIRIKYLIYKK